jgi:uncharacterized protein (DUF885 family)
MAGMTADSASAAPASNGHRPVRDAADEYVARLADLDPIVATSLGLPAGQDRLPDFSPAGQQALDDLRRATLAELGRLEKQDAQATGFADADERRCARLLRERLETELAVSESGEQLRTVSNIFGPQARVRGAFLLMPAARPADWAVIGRRIGQVPQALASYREALATGSSRGLCAAPLQVQTVASQLADWRNADGSGWFASFAAGGPDTQRAALGTAAASADAAVEELRHWLTADYLHGAEGTPDAMGADRYAIGARRWNGADLDLTEAYQWGWDQYHEIMAEMRREAGRILPGGTVREAMDYLDTHGDIVHGVPEIRARLQQVMDQAISDLDGAHFDLADPIKVVEAMIAPPGSAAAPYYTPPSQDFSRPGRTWLPTMGKTSFPIWGLLSTWYHEGVPGHHLQLAQWQYLAGQLSLYQTTVGGVSACSEGWALYAERLMDELGYLRTPGDRLGYLEAQLMRAIRVVVDIGLHLQLPIPADSPLGAGQPWTPGLAEGFFNAHSGRSAEFVHSEIVRYLSAPGQAISYKLGERAWLAGREAARSARGSSFDLKAWHMATLSLGALGLDDLAGEIAGL